MHVFSGQVISKDRSYLQCLFFRFPVLTLSLVNILQVSRIQVRCVHAHVARDSLLEKRYRQQTEVYV